MPALPRTSDPFCPGGDGDTRPLLLVCGHEELQLLPSYLTRSTWWLDPLRISLQVTARFRVKSSYDLSSVWLSVS